MLTQKRMVIPEGYIFDNVSLQHYLCNRQIGDGGDAFRKAMSGFVAVASDIANPEHLADSEESWGHIFQRWLVGKDETRGIVCAPNAVDQSREVRLFKASSPAELLAVYDDIKVGRSREDVCRAIASIAPGLNKEVTRKYEFEQRLMDSVRRSLVQGGRPEFSISPRVAEKVVEIFEACQGASRAAGRRIGVSRSLLRNHELCRDMGVGEGCLISSDEYGEELLRPCRHYQQVAFSELFNVEFSAVDIPSEEVSSVDGREGDPYRGRHRIARKIDLPTFERRIRFLPEQQKLHTLVLNGSALSDVEYSAILRVRESQWFDDSLTGLESYRRGEVWGDWSDAFNEHWKRVAQELSGYIPRWGDRVRMGAGALKELAKYVIFRWGKKEEEDVEGVTRQLGVLARAAGSWYFRRKEFDKLSILIRCAALPEAVAVKELGEGDG
ncbi:MAG: hypothetical protein H6712_24265 [Myxococcales bacterium]|nr:hypothetical protein [Myxococcales bacterium]